MASLRARLTSLAVRRLIRRDRLSREQAAPHFRKALNRPPLPTLGLRGIRIDQFERQGVRCHQLSVKRPERTLLYIHGGGFVAGRPDTYHNFCGRLAKRLHANACLPQYRLAPEHPYPAGLEDCLNTYRSLLEDGVNPKRMVVAGDSAGASLALALLLSLRDAGEPLPGCALAISPATDATLSSASHQENAQHDAMLSPAMIEHFSALYLQGEDPRTPGASPLWGDYAGLPPLLLTTSESECLRDDCYRVAEKAREAGVEVELISRRDMPHVWPIFVPLLPEANRDLKRMAAFIRRHCP